MQDEKKSAEESGKQLERFPAASFDGVNQGRVVLYRPFELNILSIETITPAQCALALFRLHLQITANQSRILKISRLTMQVPFKNSMKLMKSLLVGESLGCQVPSFVSFELNQHNLDKQQLPLHLITDKRPQVQTISHPAGFQVLVEGSKDKDCKFESLEIQTHGCTLKPLEEIKQLPGQKPKKFKSHLREHKAAVNFTGVLLKKMKIAPDGKNALVDTRYRETAFCRVPLNEKNDVAALWFFAWVTMQKNEFNKFHLKSSDGIKEFVMANCLFGASIVGKDDDGQVYPLIDHDLKVKSSITSVKINRAFHPYELTVFAAFSKLLPLMKKITKGESFKVRYHLPVIDYILYGVHLYISGKMCYRALIEYVREVQVRGEAHRQILEELAEKENVEIIIESPFDNLFPNKIHVNSDSIAQLLTLSEDQKQKLQQAIAPLQKRAWKTNSITDLINAFELWDINPLLTQNQSQSNGDEYIPPTKEYREQCETMLVEDLLEQLTTNQHNTAQREIWQKIVDSGKVDKFTPLDQLLKVANMIMIAAATSQPGVKNFEVCSLLPHEERPIASEYKKLLAGSDGFPHITCLNWLPLLQSAINQPEDLDTADSKSEKVKNAFNLFRFRPDLYCLLLDELRSTLTNGFDLPLDFWELIKTATPQLQSIRGVEVATQQSDAKGSSVSPSSRRGGGFFSKGGGHSPPPASQYTVNRLGAGT